MTQKTERIAYLYVALAILLWGSSPAISKLLLYNLNNLQVLFFVSLFATIFLFIIVLLQGKTVIIRKYTSKDYWRFIWISFIGVFLYGVFIYGGLELSSAQEAFVINYTWPLWIIILAVPLLKESFTIRKFVAIIIGFIGVYIVATNGTFGVFLPGHAEGDLLALIAGLCYGVFSILGKKYKYEIFTSMAFYFLFATIFAMITVLIFSDIPKISAYQLLGLLYLGIFPTGLAYVFWFLALKRGDTGFMSNMIFLTPFVSLIYIFFILGEPILISSVVGLILIAFGIILQSLKPGLFGRNRD